MRVESCCLQCDEVLLSLCTYVCVRACLCACVYVCACVHLWCFQRLEEGIGSPDCIHRQLWAPGTELWSSGRAVIALSCWRGSLFCGYTALLFYWSVCGWQLWYGSAGRTDEDAKTHSICNCKIGGWALTDASVFINPLLECKLKIWATLPLKFILRLKILQT